MPSATEGERERERERGRGGREVHVSHEHKAHRDAHAVPNSSKGNDVRATSYETYLWGTRYDMFNGRIAGPGLLFSHSRSPLPVLPARPPRLLMAASSSRSPPSARTGDGIDTISLLYLFTRDSTHGYRPIDADLLSVARKEKLLRARLRVFFFSFFFKRFRLFDILKMSLT